MNYGSHTYSMLDEANQHLCEISFQNSAGNQEFYQWGGGKMKANDMDFAAAWSDGNIDADNFPQWNLKIRKWPKI
jgi:catalase